MAGPDSERIAALTETIRAHPLSWRERCVGDPELDGAVSDLATALDQARMLEETEALRAEFNGLVDVWREETSGYSLAYQITAHPAYRRIIGMGRPALPLIFEYLAEHGGQWYVALHAITNADPVPEAAKGRREQAREAWLNWARELEIVSW